MTEVTKQKEAKTGQIVYVCSNQSCTAVWAKNPEGHCPKCRNPNGGGWSTMLRMVMYVEPPPIDEGEQ